MEKIWIEFLVDEASIPPNLKKREDEVKKRQVHQIQVVGAIAWRFRSQC